MKWQFLTTKFKSLTNSSREKPSKLFELENNWSAIILTVSSKGMLVNSGVTSKLALTTLLLNFCSNNSCKKENVSLIEYWLTEIGRSKGTRNLAILKEWLLIDETIGRRGMLGLWTLGNPYKISGLDPVGANLLNSSLLITLDLLRLIISHDTVIPKVNQISIHIDLTLQRSTKNSLPRTGFELASSGF